MKIKTLFFFLVTPLLFSCSNTPTPTDSGEGEGGEESTAITKEEFDNIVSSLSSHQFNKLTVNFSYKFLENGFSDPDYESSTTDVYQYQDGAWTLISGSSPAEDFNTTLTVSGRISDMDYYDLETMDEYHFEYFKDPLVLKLFTTFYDDEDDNTTYSEDFCSFNEHGLCTLETMKYHTVNADESTYTTLMSYQYIWED